MPFFGQSLASPGPLITTIVIVFNEGNCDAAGQDHHGTRRSRDRRALADSFGTLAAQDDRQGAFPLRQIEALHGAGLLALTAPRAQGGRGAGLELTARVIAEIGRGDPAVALILVMQYAHLALLDDGRWPRHLAGAVMRSAVEEGALINALRVEPDLGTPLRGGLPATTARRSGDGWRLSGSKIYSTGSEGLRWGIVWARTDEAEPRVGQFLVAIGAKGVEIVPTWDSLGLRASPKSQACASHRGPARRRRHPRGWCG